MLHYLKKQIHTTLSNITHITTSLRNNCLKRNYAAQDTSAALRDSLIRAKYAKNETVANGMVQALASSLGRDSPILRYSIVPEDESFHSSNALSMMGESGLNALASAVERELPSDDEMDETCSVIISVPHHNLEFDLPMRNGQNLKELASLEGDLAEYLECACGGNMSCSSCHVYIDDESYRKLLGGRKTIDEAEQDMLDLAFEPRDGSSRLGCQVVMAKELNGMKVTIPSEAHNLWK